MTPKPVDLDALSALLEKATPGELIKESFLLIHKVATKQSSRSYMSIPADPTRDADLIVGDALKHYAALRNAAHAMIQELRELRQDVKTFQFDATLYRNRLADALAQADALRAELKEIKDDKSWNDGVIFDLRAEVEGLKAQSEALCADVVEARRERDTERTSFEVACDQREKAENERDALRAQLATAHDALRLFEEGRKLFVDGLDDRAQDRFEQAADAMKTTKGGGA